MLVTVTVTARPAPAGAALPGPAFVASIAYVDPGAPMPADPSRANAAVTAAGAVTLLFALGLLASTAVGCHAGALAMDGFLRRRAPLMLIARMSVMGVSVDPRVTTRTASLVVTAVVAVTMALLYLTIGGVA